MTPGYPVLVPLSRSAASSPDRLFFDARLSGFRCLSPAPQRLLLTGYFTARISGFRCPGTFFSLPVFGILGRLFRRPPFSHPTFPSRLFGWPARSLCCLTVGLRFLPPRGFYRSAVFTAPRFLPLRGFLPLRFHRFLGGLCSSAALVLAVPQSSPTSGRLALWATLRYACEFYRSATFTAPRFLPLRGFYRSAVFTAPRFLPLHDFFRSAFAGSLGGSALPFCPPVFALFRAHPVLPAPPSRLRGDTVLDLLFGPPAYPLSERYRSSHRFPFCTFHTH